MLYFLDRMKASEQKQNSIKTEGNESSSDSEDSDSSSDMSSSESVRNSQKSHKIVPQFSVLRSESDGLRMKISAVRNVQNISDKKKTSNNNNDRSSKKSESRSSKKKESRASSSGSSSSYCSVCSRSDSDDSSSDSQQEKHRKIRLKRKKVHTMNAPAERKPAPVQNVAYPVWTSDKKVSKTQTTTKKPPVEQPSVSGTKKCPPPIGSDVIPTDCVSSSDTELPALVSAAIKCVESSSEVENCSSEPPLQYNSALLHDFMIKTQMLGSCTEIATLKRKNLVNEEKPVENVAKPLSETPEICVQEKVPETPNEAKKKRGRPKKQNTTKESQKILVNESLDSGITSTAQSLSPSPNSPAPRENASEKSRESRLTTNGTVDTRDTAAPKISIINLEKQIYATERVLYPPRGRKKSVGKSRTKTVKSEIDPIWKKIDVNSKFHRPILTGYKSDGGSTVCSKRRRSKSGYVSDYGKHYSGYKSDRSGKSRYSTKSCASRAKSCDYRSDYSNVSRKSRRKKKSNVKHSKSFSSVNEQDILQLAGLTLGQTSEESSRESLEKTVEEPCSSKKYGEINRFIRTGEYFGGIKKFSDNYKFGSSPSHMLSLDKSIFRSCGAFPGKTYPKPTPVTPTPIKDNLSRGNEKFCTKIRSRRSSAISRCSSMSMVSKYNLKRRRRRKFRTRSQSRYSCIDPKFHIQLEILVNSFATLCRIDGESMSKFSNLKERVEREKKAASKRSFKKRKLSENLEHYQITNLKRKHKKSGHNSPDEHKLPLKKRHYLLMPGEKCDAKSFHLMEAKNKELCDIKYSLKSTNNNVKVPSKPVTPKKRHLLETPHNAIDMHAALLSKYNTMPCNDLKPLLSSPERITDIVSQKLLNQVKNDIIKKKNRLEGLVSKMQSICSSAGVPTGMSINQVIDKPPPKFPPPGIFEPSSELEIQIPLAKLSGSVVTKSEVDSPKVLPDELDYERTLPEPKTERVVETLLNKTGGHLLMRKKRKKVFNRTGFPTVKKRKRKMELEPRVSFEGNEKKCSTNSSNIVKNKQPKASGNKTDTTLCDRVPHVGEASTTFLERNKQPRLSVVSLERLQDPNKKREVLEIKQNESSEANVSPIERTKKNRSSSVKTKKETPVLLVTQDLTGNNDHVVADMQTQPSTNEAKKTEETKTEEPVKPENRKLCAKINLRRNTISLTIDNEMTVEPPEQLEPEEKKENKVENVEANTENATASVKLRLRQREIENSPKRKNRTKQNQISKPVKPNAIIKKPFVKPEMKNAIVRIVRKKIDEAQGSIISDDKLVKKIKIENINNLKKPKVVAKPIKQEKPTEASDESLEQEPLPLNEEVCTENQEQIELNESFAKGKKVAKWRKTYLTAGLLSDTFKIDRQKKLNVKEKFSEEETSEQTSILPPPPYCEKFFRRTVYDFLLPYDIWWAHTNSKLPARVTVPSWNYKKIRTNVYGDVKPNPVVDHQVCNCKPQSGCGDDCLNRLVYTECFPTSCPSQDKCQNQKIQKHEWAPGIERFMTENKGWGVRTNLSIRKGTYILEYVGEVVTEKEFKRRMATLYVNDTHHYCLNLDGGLVIDGHRMGSDGRFVNHSCSPNCEMQKWSVNGLFRMALFALRNIEPGEELTYDYNFSLFNPSEGQPCRCETPQCRGVIGGKSQRVKPVDTAKIIDPNILNRHSRARKRQAKKNSGRYQSKDVIIPQFQLPSDREKKIIKGSNCFLIRNLEKVQKLKFRPIKSSEIARPLTPSSIAVQISALRVPRNIKTRGLTQAAHDPEVERMAKMAVVFRDICSELENLKDANGKSQIAKLLPAAKRKRNSQDRIKKPLDFATVQTNVEKGLYKQPEVFDEDMNKVFSSAITHFGTNTDEARAVDALSKAYIQMKHKAYDQLAKLVNKKSLKNFRPIQENKQSPNIKRAEDIIRCICGLFKDEGLMIQCAKCLCWQHAECTKADTKAEYCCERCVPRNVDYEIPLNEFTEEGYRYYLSLLRGKLQIRQGDTVYVLRDIPIKDENGKTLSSKKHTYETIGEVDYSECDIFRIERMWKNEEGKRFVFGHHYLRPHETFHEPTRKFYENEVVRVPLYEVVPIELVIARCWVLDRSTFCKGRPVDCPSEQHVYICELRVDKSARFFSKVRQVYPTCTKEYAFRTFPEKLKITRNYAPHEVDPALLKSRKRRPEDTPPQQRKHSYPIIQLLPPPAKTMNERRTRLENVVKNIRLRLPDGGEPTAADLSYLLTGRRARQRKANAASVPV